MPAVAFVALSSLLTYLSFPNIFSNEGYPLIMWIALVPFLWALDGQSLVRRILLGGLWGMVTFLLLVRWLAPVSVVGYVLFAGALALGAVLFSLFCIKKGERREEKGEREDKKRVTLKSSSDSRKNFFSFSFFSSPFSFLFSPLFYIPSLWVFTEYLRNSALGGFTWSIAYSQAFWPDHIRLAFVGGVYAVAWVIVFVNTAIFLALKTKGLKNQFWVAGILAFVINWLIGAASSDPVVKATQRSRFLLVQPNISYDEKFDEKRFDDNVARHLMLTKQGVIKGFPDAVVWPETAFPDDILRDDRWRPRMESIAKNFHTNFIFGSALLADDGRDINAALHLSPDGQWAGRYEKIKLVPFSEYSPSEFVGKAVGVRGYHFARGKSAGVFDLSEGFVGERGERREGREAKLGVVICSEEAYPGLFRDLARREVSLLLVLLNDGWFKLPEALMMHAQNGIFRAVETGRPLLRSANSGWTVGFDSHGRRLAAQPLSLQRPGSVLIDVAPGRGLTPYVRFGDVFVWGCGMFVLIYNLVMRLRRKVGDGRRKG